VDIERGKHVVQKNDFGIGVDRSGKRDSRFLTAT
jgi:hypothetical protein